MEGLEWFLAKGTPHAWYLFFIKNNATSFNPFMNARQSKILNLRVKMKGKTYLENVLIMREAHREAENISHMKLRVLCAPHSSSCKGLETLWASEPLGPYLGFSTTYLFLDNLSKLLEIYFIKHLDLKPPNIHISLFETWRVFFKFIGPLPLTIHRG